MLHVITDAQTAPGHFGAMAALFARSLQTRALQAPSWAKHAPQTRSLQPSSSETRLLQPNALQTASLQPSASPVMLMHLPTLWDLCDYPEAVQHVAAEGTLLPSGLLWSERLLGLPAMLAADLDTLMARARIHDVVLPLHPSVNGQPFLERDTERLFPPSSHQRLQLVRDLLCKRAHASGTPLRLYSVKACDGGWSLIDDDKQLPVAGLRYCFQDTFGRWQTGSDTDGHPDSDRDSDPDGHSASTPSSGVHGTDALSAPARSMGSRPLHVALIGSERDQYEGYPATLAALGDAADAAGISLMVDFVTPQTLTQRTIAERLSNVDGIVLPGGSDMARVAGQIEAARFAFQSGMPTVGLCLGMQSMATAVAQIALNDDTIGLAEVGASLPDQSYPQSFIPIDASGPSLHHRLGDRHSQLLDGSRLQAILGDVIVTRYNHRYRLNEALIGPLKTAGVQVSARENMQFGAEDKHAADAIEAPAHPFFIGMQGHPELSSCEGRPHPLLVAFLQAADAARRESGND